MKRKILSVTIILTMLLSTLIPLSVSAATSGKCGDNVNWTLSNGVLTLSGYGEMYNDYFTTSSLGRGYTPWYNNKTEIKKIIVESGVTNIGQFAFDGCSSLETISLPNTVTNIGSYAFSHCENLKSISLPDNLESLGGSAFEYCKKLQEISLSYGITKIPNYCFEGCTDLRRVEIPKTVTKIGFYAFDNAYYYTRGYGTIVYLGSESDFNQSNFTIDTQPYGVSFRWEYTDITVTIVDERGEVILKKNFLKDAPLLDNDIPKIGNSSYAIYRNNTYSGGALSLPLILRSDSTYYIRYTHTKTSNSEGEFIVNPIVVPANSIIIFACYNDNKMVYVNPYVYAGETTIPFSTTETYDKVKVMIWENLETCVPLCEAEDVPLN